MNCTAATSEGVYRLLIVMLEISAETVTGCAQTAHLTHPGKAWHISFF
jgi:hypothetical protein